MNIALSFCGLCREISHTKNIMNFLTNNEHNYVILLTTWENVDTTEFSNYFPDSYIYKVEIPTENITKEWLKDYRMDDTNPHKPVINYFYQLYIRNNSQNTINEYEIKENIKFDIIVTLRTDVELWENITKYFNFIKNDDNNIFVGNGPNFNIYGTGSCQDVLFFSSKSIMFKILNYQYNFPEEIQPKKNIFHPETCQFNCFRNLQLNIQFLPFQSFVFGHEERYRIVRKNLGLE